MNKIERSECPECLASHSAEWTEHFIRKRKKDPGYWDWHQFKGLAVNSILVPLLTAMSQGRCSYCNIYPVIKGAVSPSIDHFRPKSKFPELAFEWSNLFLSCQQCQSYKRDDFDEPVEPLKPDALEYDFDHWFQIKWEDCTIEPNPLRSPEEQKRAEATIEWLGLNRDSRPQVRASEVKRYSQVGGPLEDWSYAFLLERC